MPEVTWLRMMRVHPAGHLLVGVLPQSDGLGKAASPGTRDRQALLSCLAGLLDLRGHYALTTTDERYATEVYCVLAEERDADRMSEAIGARRINRYVGWASQRGFRFDDKIAKSIMDAINQTGPFVRLSRPRAKART